MSAIISKTKKVKWNDIKYSDPNPKKWVLDSAYPSDKTSQKALKCFKDDNPEKRLLLEQLSSKSIEKVPEKSVEKSVLGQKQPEKKRKRLLSSDEDDFALDTIVTKVRKENSEKNISRKSSSEDSSKKKKSTEEEKENRPKEKVPEVLRNEPEVPVVRKEPEVVEVKEPEIVKVPAKIGHAIDPKINSVVEVDIGEAPKRTGPCFEYLQTIGHRIIQLSEHSIDVQINVQGRFKSFYRM